MKRRKHKQPCTHLRVTQDIISNCWKIYNKNNNGELKNDTNDVDTIDIINNNNKIREAILTKSKETVQVHKSKEKIINECSCNVLDVDVKPIEVEVGSEDMQNYMGYPKEEISSKLCVNEADSKQKISIDYSCISVDCNGSDLSLRSSENIHEENQCFNKKLDETPPQSIPESQIVKISCDNETYSPKHVSQSAFGTQRKSSLGKITEVLSDEELIENIDSNVYKPYSRRMKKQSQSDTSFSETIITDNCMDSILYRELRKRCIPTNRKKHSLNSIKDTESIELKSSFKSSNTKSYQESDIDTENIGNFSDDARILSEKHKQNYNSKKRSMNKHQLISRCQKKCLQREIEIGSTFPTAWQKVGINYKRTSKFRCENCSCDAKLVTSSLIRTFFFFYYSIVITKKVAVLNSSYSICLGHVIAMARNGTPPKKNLR